LHRAASIVTPAKKAVPRGKKAKKRTKRKEQKAKENKKEEKKKTRDKEHNRNIDSVGYSISNQTERLAYRTAALAQVPGQMFPRTRKKYPKAGRFVLAQARVLRCAFSCNIPVFLSPCFRVSLDCRDYSAG